MTHTYAPSVWARRILIAVLAFALAVAFAVAASSLPAHADDPKDFNVFVGVEGTHPASGTQVTVEQGSAGVTFTFENPDEETNTQQAGSFQVVFPSGFESLDRGKITLTSASGSDTDASATWTATASGDTVNLFANSGGNRLGIDEKISVDVTFFATQIGIFGPSDFTITADQQAGGVPAGGGNQFTQANASPTITVNCAAGSQCSVSASGAGDDVGTAACDPEDGCTKAGLLSIDFKGSDQDCDGNECSLWVADASTGGDAFYLIIDTDGAKKPTIYAQLFLFDEEDDRWEAQFVVGGPNDGDPIMIEARNCQPPKTVYGCIDIKHPDYSKKLGVYPLRFPAEDPAGGYG